MKELLHKARANNKKDYLLYGLFFFLPLSVFMSNVVLGALLLFSVYEAIKRHNTDINYIKWFGPFLIYIVILSLISGFATEDLDYFKLLLPVVLMPIATQNFSKEKFLNGLIYLSIGITIIQILALYGVITYYLDGNVELRNYKDINEVLFYERPYLGFFSALNFIIHYHLFKKYRKIISIAILLFSIILVVIISARLAFIIIVLSIIFFVWVELKRKKTQILWISAAAILGAGLFIFFGNSALKQRFLMIKFDSRLVIWNGGISQLNSSSDYFFGVGSQSVVDSKLMDYYKNEAEFEYFPDKIRFVESNYNLHNQYLNELVRGGIIGLLLFALPLLLMLYLCYRKKFYLPSIFLLSLIIFLFVENLLERQIGVYTLSLLYIFAIKHIDEIKSD